MSETARNLSTSSSVSSLLGVGSSQHERLGDCSDSVGSPTSPTQSYQSLPPLKEKNNIFSGFDSGYQRLNNEQPPRYFKMYCLIL